MLKSGVHEQLLEETVKKAFLGKAHYENHEGSRPMNIVWRLDKPIPAQYLRKTNKLLVG